MLWRKPRSKWIMITNTPGKSEYTNLSKLKEIIQRPDACVLTPLLSCHPIQHRSISRIKRNAANPSDILRLLKQPVGATRSAVRAADYMDASIRLIQKRSLTGHHIQKRSINATGWFRCRLYNWQTLYRTCCWPSASLLQIWSLRRSWCSLLNSQAALPELAPLPAEPLQTWTSFDLSPVSATTSEAEWLQ